jgi:hypothetical protein
MRSTQMVGCLDEVWGVLEELPSKAQEIWTQAFREALPVVHGDMRKAAAMAWNVFKVKERPVELWQAKLTNCQVMNQWSQFAGLYRERKESQTKPGRTLRLVKGAERLRVKNSGDWSGDLQPETKSEPAAVPRLSRETSEAEKFVSEIREILGLPGGVSLAEIKQSIAELAAYRKDNDRREEQREIPKGLLIRELVGMVIEAAVEAGKISPYERAWAETSAVREWREFKEFLELAPLVDSVKKKKRSRIFTLIRSLVWRR